MALVRWTPFGELQTLADRMNRLMGDAFRTVEGEGELGSAWYPVVDIYEKGDDLVLEAELPGLKKDELDVRVENNVLTLRGQRKREHETKENGYVRTERAYGTFTRSFTLPTTVAVDKINATYKDGVLTLTLPRAEEAKPKQIPVKLA
jgi:HSP20 family protein